MGMFFGLITVHVTRFPIGEQAVLGILGVVGVGASFVGH